MPREAPDYEDPVSVLVRPSVLVIIPLSPGETTKSSPVMKGMSQSSVSLQQRAARVFDKHSEYAVKHL